MRFLDQTKNNLSSQKIGWMARFDQYKKQIKEANELAKKEYAKYTQQGVELEKLKRMREE